MNGVFASMNVMRVVSSATALGFFAASALAGNFIYKGGTWGSFSGSAARHDEAIWASPDLLGIAPRLKLTSPATGDDYDLQGKFSFTVTWSPKGNEKVPKKVVVTFHKQATMSAHGKGIAKVLAGSKELAKLDSSVPELCGATTYISDVSVTLNLVHQRDGTYVAHGSFTTDKLSTTYGADAVAATYAEESFSLCDMQPGK